MEKVDKNIAGRVRTLLEPKAAELGYAIWDVEYVKEGAEMVLRITIDKPDGIDINDCETVHRTIDPILDEADPIEGTYRLEVSSPGMERLLTRPEHFQSCLGQTVEVRLFAPLDGRRIITGRLAAAEEKTITVEENGTPVVIPRASASKVRTVFDWTQIG